MNLARFRFAMGGGLIVCILFGAVDWLVVAHIHPAAFIPFLTLRLGIIVAPVISLIATQRLPNMSPRTLKAFDLATFTSVAGMISLMCVWFRGIISPYYAGVIVVVVCRRAAMPTNWRSGVLYFGLPAATFRGIMLALAPFDQQIARQLQSPPQLALFALNVIFIASSLLLVIIGSHAVWALRRQLYATRSLGRYGLESRLGAGGMGEVWHAHHPKPLRYPSHLLGSPVPAELEGIVVRCLAKDREQRFPDAKSLVSALMPVANSAHG